MKNIIFLLLTLPIFFGCNKSIQSSQNGLKNSDTIILKGNEIIFISPSEKSIENLKKAKGEDFYTIADDANNYYTKASGFLDSMKVSYVNYDDSKIIGYKKNNKFFEIPKFKNPWYVIFYKDESFKTLNLIDTQQEYTSFFKKNINMSENSESQIKKITDSISNKKYFIIKDEKCDLNNDSQPDHIVVFGNNADIDPQNPETKIAPVAVLLKDSNKKYIITKNENIFPNDFGDTFKNIVVKNSYFTIELSNEIPDKYTSSKYITFKYSPNSKEINLYKYGENIEWSDGRVTKKLCTDKNFGKISFKNYSSNRIRNLCE